MRNATQMLAVFLLLAAVAVASRANIITPSNQYTDLGALSVTGGGAFDTNGTTPTLTVGGTVYNGQIATYTNGLQAAVFLFDSVTISGGTLTGSGALPVALLSFGDVTLSGTGAIDFSGDDGLSQGPPGSGGPGGGAGGAGSNPPQNGAGPGGGQGAEYAGGGGFGGPGGGDTGTLYGAGGASYGDLFQALQGGSGGGGARFDYAIGGGGGGGGLEIAANGSIVIGGGGIKANGGIGNGENEYAGAGGGSGGGLLLYAPSITLTAALSANGANGGTPGYETGSGGGGGRILIDTAIGGFAGDKSLITVSAGKLGNSGTKGSLIFAEDVQPMQPVPEPGTLWVMGIGLMGLALTWRRSRIRSLE